MGGPALLLCLLLAPLLLPGRQLHPHLLQVLLLQQQASRSSAAAVLLPRLVLRNSAVTMVWLPRAGAAAGCSELLLQQRGRRLLLGWQMVHTLHLRESGEAGSVQLGGQWTQDPAARDSVPAIAAAKMKHLTVTGAAAPRPTSGSEIHNQLPQIISSCGS